MAKAKTNKLTQADKNFLLRYSGAQQNFSPAKKIQDFQEEDDFDKELDLRLAELEREKNKLKMQILAGEKILKRLGLDIEQISKKLKYKNLYRLEKEYGYRILLLLIVAISADAIQASFYTITSITEWLSDLLAFIPIIGKIAASVAKTAVFFLSVTEYNNNSNINCSSNRQNSPKKSSLTSNRT